MKIPIPSELSPLEVIRRAGYGQVMDRRATEVSYNRRLGSGFYPRFHVYLNGQTVNLHLDQKQASYEGYSAHSGEYDGEPVESEGERIRQVAESLLNEKLSQPDVPEEPEKTGFWSKIFG